MPRRQIPLVGSMGPHSLFRSEGITTPFSAADPGAHYQWYLNGYFEENKGAQDDSRRIAYCKRPGLDEATHAGLTNLTGTGTFGNNYKITGQVTSLDLTKLIAVGQNGSAFKSYYYDGSSMTSNAPPAGWTSTGCTAFTQLDGISYGANVYYAATDFNKGAVINASGVWTEISDADFAGLTKVTNIVGLDGYLFIGTSNNRIYNSDLNSATSWVSTSFLTAADRPGALVWLARLRNYLVVFKQYSIEFFENVGAPTPGSPLKAVKQLNRNIGCVSASSVQYTQDGIIFLGISKQGPMRCYKIMGDSFEIEPISDSHIEAAMSNFIPYQTYSVDFSTASNAASGQSQIVTYRGKEFYVVNLPNPNTGANSSYCYDNDTKKWSAWATALTTNGSADSGFLAGQCVLFKKGTVVYNLFANNANVGASQACIWNAMHTQPGVVQDYKDSSTALNYPFVWQSDIYDFGTRQPKFMDSVEVVYDCYPTANPSNSGSTTFTLTTFDTDYSLSSGGSKAKYTPHSVIYDAGHGRRAVVSRLGRFFDRSFKILVTDANPWRIWVIEVSYNVGGTDQDS